MVGSAAGSLQTGFIGVGATSLVAPTVASLVQPQMQFARLEKIKTICVHDLVPGRDEVVNEFLLAFVAGINF